jgi:AraC family transcriptional regulator
MICTTKEINQDQQNRINRIFSFIEDNLDSNLSLNKVSSEAYISPFHFHRLFKVITGETLNEYVTRKRIEKSALDLLHSKNPVRVVAFKLGFSSTSSFSKTFKKFYGVSPTEFQVQNPNRFSKIRQLKSKNGQPYPETEQYICIITNLKTWVKMNAKIEIREINTMNLACASCNGPQNLQKAYQKILGWATPLNLVNESSKMLTIYHDSFKVTEPEKVRMSACLILEEAVELNPQVESRIIEKGKFLVGHFEITMIEFEKSWTGLFLWMNENGYEKEANKEPFEIYHNNPNEHPDKKAIVDLCIPIL